MPSAIPIVEHGTQLNQSSRLRIFPISFDYYINLQSITSVMFPDQLIFEQRLIRFFLSTFFCKFFNCLFGLCFLQRHNERTGLHVPLLVGLKILLGGSSVQRAVFNLKEALKKARKSCSYRPLCKAKSYVSLDERGISLPSVTEKEPPTNIDQIEPVERMEEQRTPCTCAGKPLLRSIPCLNTEGDIIAAPSELQGLPSRKKKRKLATPLLQNSKIMSSSFLICVAISMLLSAGGIVYIASFIGEYRSK